MLDVLELFSWASTPSRLSEVKYNEKWGGQELES